VLLQLSVVWLLGAVICFCFVAVAKNIEEECLRITQDVLDESSDSENHAFVNTDLDSIGNYVSSADEESTGKCDLFHKLNFPFLRLPTFMNSNLYLLYFSYFWLRFRIIQ
jgi:hypothetical protein